ncbi:hypothetical protein DSO57_1004073 [Entomophthora muscae]|uniref:Uncharacterized protein n=1 Tax=Entomophthora muscae TaxID=34485 RepID=A0ACC2U7H9_9FUNG|nr:hypothetical protein DSO57_1004073 [Entomophthora muscae]
MTPSLTLQPNCPQEFAATKDATFTQMFGVLYITPAGLVDYMVPNTGPWSLLGDSILYVIKLAPMLWWALPSGPVVPCPRQSVFPPTIGILISVLEDPGSLGPPST